MKNKVARPKDVREAPAGYNESAIVIYETADGVRLDVKLERDTLWLTQKQMAELFETERSVITKHLRNIFKSGELIQDSVCANFALTAADGKAYQTAFYQLRTGKGRQPQRCPGAVMQTFGGQDVYPDIEEKAAHLLYFLIKDHPFVDGNKRIGAALFLWFLEKNGALYHRDGTKRIADTALVAMTLLIAESKPAEKELLTRVLINLIGRREP